ncbi:MAG: EF-P 5-aminopentanol modification-associated protein YfmF [Deltaproteobacteria bacterium]
MAFKKGNGIELKKYNTKKGINIIAIKTDKFKTASINLFIHNQLDREAVTKNALIPMVLKRGSKDLPTMQEISRKLENLYGSYFDSGVVKKGERQIQHFFIDGVNEEFLPGGEKILDSCARVLDSIVSNPLLDGKDFRSDYIQQEKDNLSKLIQARKNDKVQYAVERCYELMCTGERYGIHEWGKIEDLEGITSENLFETYQKNISKSKVDILLLGNLSDKWISKLEEIIGIQTDNSNLIEKEETKKQVSAIRTFVDEMDVNQGKLSMGFRTNIGLADSDYYNLLVYNSILGGGVHSKLFQNVREKNSLAYYVFSRLDKFKGTMMISSGVEASNFEKAKNIILEQINDIKAGTVTEKEYETSIKALENNLRNLADEPIQLVDFCLGQSIIGSDDSIEEILTKIRSVKLDQVIKVSEKIQLDTIHYIKPKEGR